MGSSYGTFTITDVNDVQQIWYDGDGTHMVATKEGLTPPIPFIKGDETTYGSNSFFNAQQLSFGYDTTSITTIGVNGIQLYSLNWDEENQLYDNNLEATIDTQGLTIAHGGLEAGFKDNDYIYIWSEDRLDRERQIGNSDIHKNDWRIVAGNNFGVDKSGNLYAAEAHISGDIVAKSLMINYDGQLQDGVEVINDAGTKATNFISTIDNGGIKIHDQNENYNTYTKIDNRGMDIVLNDESVAFFGVNLLNKPESRIGKADGYHIQLTESQLAFCLKESQVAYVSTDQLYITRSVVLQQMNVGIKKNEQDISGKQGKGQWSWKVHENINGDNNLYLKWIG